MMHFKDTVIVVCDSNKKPLKEYDVNPIYNGRSSRVNIAVDSEYQLMIKNIGDRRIKLDIDIDGSNITNSGIVCAAGYEGFIERFLNSDKKFKAISVKSGEVADPTSPENGNIIVRVSREKAKPNLMLRSLNATKSFGPRSPRGWHPGNDVICKGDGGNYAQYTSGNIGSVLRGCVPEGTTSVDWMVPDYSQDSATEKVATGEGSYSNQTFGTTTWEGDYGVEAVFSFKLVGIKEKSAEYQEYLRLKSKFG